MAAPKSTPVVRKPPESELYEDDDQEDDEGFSFLGLTSKNSNRSQAVQTTDQVNTSFPIALLCRMNQLKIDPNFLKLTDGELEMSTISPTEIIGDAKKVYFGFEATCANPRYTRFTNLPRADVCVSKNGDRGAGVPIEVKLVVVPDQSTINRTPEDQGPELVVRPDSIAQVAAYLCAANLSTISAIFAKYGNLNLKDEHKLRHNLPLVIECLRKVAQSIDDQSPFLCMPTWHTDGDEMTAFDMFFISDAAFVEMICEISSPKTKVKKITRPMRTAMWLYLLLKSACEHGTFDWENIFQKHGYSGSKNDKAFALNGTVMNRFVRCPNLTNPRVPLSEIDKIMSVSVTKPKRIFSEMVIKNWPRGQ